jgi:hypothetical protein
MEQKCGPHNGASAFAKATARQENAPEIGSSWLRINFSPSVLKFLSFLSKPSLDCYGFVDSLFCRITSNVFRYPHAAEMGTAH